MPLRGQRTCAECGRRWSYFETGSVDCPACGSVRSVAVADEAVLHTRGDTTLDLSAARAAVDDRPLRDVARLAAAASRAYLADRGFIDAGELQPLDDVTLAVAELRAVSDQIHRSMAADDAAEHHLLALIQGASDGDRPADVPPAFRPARGRGAAAAVERYRADLVRYLGVHPAPEARRVLGPLRDQLRRVEALEGDVSVETVDRLVAAARDLGAYLSGEEAALARAEDRLSWE